MIRSSRGACIALSLALLLALAVALPPVIGQASASEGSTDRSETPSEARSASPALLFPDNAPGKIAAAFFPAYNSGDESAMRRFYETHVSPEGLKRRSVAERLEVVRGMRSHQGRLTPLEMKTVTETSVELIVRNQGGSRVRLTFLCEDEAPHMLAGIRVEDLPDDRGADQDTEPGTEAPEDGSRARSSGPGAGSPEIHASPKSDAEIVAALRAHMDSLRKSDEFSGAVLLAKGKSPLFREAYGLASRAAKAPNRPDTKFNLGSINKAFTRLAIEQLAKAGKLRLDDTIDTWVPEYPADKGRRITIAQLLDHRGGVGDVFGPKYETADKTKLREIKDWIPLFRDEPLRFEPGTQQAYSNGGYVLLGRAVETASGRSYYDYVRERIYAPAGMTDTESYFLDRPVENRAIGYTRSFGKGEGATWQDASGDHPARGSSAGGGYSTVDDLLRFAGALREDRFGTGTKSGGIGIAGGSPGTNAVLESAGEYTVVVLANVDPPAAERLAKTIRGWLPKPRGVSTAAGAGVIVVEGTGDDGAGPAVAGGEAGPRVVRRVAGPGGASGGPGRRPEKTVVPESGVDVPMLESGHLPAVEVMVNGKGPFKFAIDTGGAGFARISAALAGKLGLETIGEVQAGDPSGKNMRTLRLVALDAIDLAGARFTGLNASIIPEDEIHRDESADGILGFGLFADCLFTLDYPASRVRIARGELPTPNGKDVLAYSDRHGIPSMTIRVGGVDIDADIDAGSMGGFSLPDAFAAKLKLASEPRVVGHARTMSSSFDIKAADLAGEITFGGYSFTNPVVEFQPAFPVANVGSRVLRDFALTFDQSNHRVRIVRRV